MLRRNSGFTLIELIIVLTLMGIIASVTMFRLSSGTEGYRVTVFRERMIQDLRSARSEALARNQEVILEFSSDDEEDGVDDRDYNIFYFDSSNNVVAINKHPYPLEKGVTVTFANLKPTADGCDRIVFNKRGKITNITTGNNSGTITISCGSYSESITVIKETGFIRAE